MAAMEARLTREVTRMRAQMMNFSNEGAEFSLNVPDTNEVKDVFSQVVTTVVQQQRQITTLQKTMKQMAEDHAASQAALVSWTAQIVNDLVAQNASTEERLHDARMQLRNFSYNIQGFADEVDTAPPLPPPIKIIPPPIFKTATPKIITDPMEVGDGGEGTLFPTETGASPDASLNVSENPRPGSAWGGQVVGASAVGEEVDLATQTKRKHRKSDEERALAKRFYLSVGSPQMPKSVKGRWRWAFRLVLRSIRHKKLNVGLTRGKVPLHKTTAERIDRIEHEIFAIPIALKEYTNKLTTQVHNRITQEVGKIETALEEAREETLRLTGVLQTNIDKVKDDLQVVDDRLAALKEQVDNANKQADEVERKLNAVVGRVAEHEVALFDSIKSRVAVLVEKVGALKAQAASTADKLGKLSEEAEKRASAGENDQAEEGPKLFEMLEFDTTLRAARLEINALDSSAFAVGEIIRGIRYELLSASVLTGEEKPVDKEVVNDMLAHCDNIVSALDAIFSTVHSSNDLWAGHDEQLAGRWKTLSGVADAVKMVASMSATLEEVRATVESMPTLDVVESTSKAAAAAAVAPVDQKVDIVEDVVRDLTKQLSEVKKSGGGGGGMQQGDLDSQLEPLIQRIVEMHMSSGKVTNSSWIKSGEAQEDIIFTEKELELVFARAEISDDITDEQLQQGSMVRVLAGEHQDKHGVITAVVEPQGHRNQAEEGEGKGEGGATDPAEVRFRVTLSPESPLRTPNVNFGSGEGLEPPFGDFESIGAARVTSGEISQIQQEIARLSSTIQDLLSGKLTTSQSSRPSRAADNGAGLSMDGQVREAIQEAISDVLGQIGDLRALQEKELTKAKQQMKNAIITAITRAITDKDKESFLTTKSMCVGCGRPSFVRREDNSQPAVNIGFIPGLNAGSTAGPDVYRSGFKLPVHVQHKASSSPEKIVVLSNDIFDELEDDSSARQDGNSISTYSQIIAGMTGGNSFLDAGAMGVAMTISPSASPSFYLFFRHPSSRHGHHPNSLSLLTLFSPIQACLPSSSVLPPRASATPRAGRRPPCCGPFTARPSPARRARRPDTLFRLSEWTLSS